MHESKIIHHLREDEQVARTLIASTWLRGGFVLATVALLAVVGIALLVMN
ncbi:MAG: hypothetical protein SFV54_04805 [Bryobacteraceae bacterium]|nr:hypothetical protein [Bryobacteraceae bacterium]